MKFHTKRIPILVENVSNVTCHLPLKCLIATRMCLVATPPSRTETICAATRTNRIGWAKLSRGEYNHRNTIWVISWSSKGLKDKILES